jgi:excinuclease ABC subunit C
VTGLPVVGLAKEKENVRGDKLVDRVYLPGQKNPVPLREGSSALFYLAQLRDEAHRASNALRVKLGKRRRLRSGLADVPGVGPRTAALLLRTLGSLRAVLAADEAALTAAGATTRQAKAIAAHFAAGTTASEPPLEADGADDPASATEQDDLALDALTLDGLPLDEEESDTLPADARPALDGGDDGSEDAAVERAFTQG